TATLAMVAGEPRAPAREARCAWPMPPGGGCLRAAVAQLPFEVQRRDDGALLVLAPLLPGEEVHHLEFVPVGVVAIEALRRPVIGFADERIRAQEILAGLGQVLDRGDLPSEVVQAGRPARRTRRIGADREQAQI